MPRLGIGFQLQRLLSRGELRPTARLLASREALDLEDEGDEMQKRWIGWIALTLFALSAMALAAENHKFRLAQDASINGTELKAGQYQIRLNGDDEAEILQHGKLVAKSEVEVQPLNQKSLRNSVVIRSGQIAEIRLKTQRIVIKQS